jgi:NodT family efflux transporter outer membrane factor (OMF) lipoprotein
MRQTLIFLCACTLSACAVGPNYHRPAAPTPTHFKEADGWKAAEPREAASGTAWWSVYEDATLDSLEKQIDISNQTLKASEAAWREAVAVAQVAGAQIYPSTAINATAQRSRGTVSSFTSTNPNGGTGTRPAPVNEFSVSGSASWDLDIWGRIRRTIESDVASAKASESDLAAARLSAQATLAVDYVELRLADEQIQLLADTIKGYQRSLDITQNQYKVGVAAKADVITAQTQLEGAQSQQIGLGVTRTQLEHAIAVLIGKPPADFTLTPATLAATIPVVPAGVPSALLERRPDISSAERKMAAANAQIGVAVAAYFPDLTLSGSFGFASPVTAGLLRTPNNVWSVGAAASDALFDFGARRYQVREARAAYDGTVATYRQTVLTAFQQVEDELAALRILESQYQVADQTVKDANLAVTLTLNQYRAGIVAYTAVVTAQAIALSDAQALLSVRQSRLVASVTLIQALGGGWSTQDLSPVHVALPTPL